MAHGHRRALLLAFPLLLTVPLSGCTDCEAAEAPVSARLIGPGTENLAGSGPYRLSIKITDGPGGPPVPDAGVVVYWDDDRPGQWSGPMVRVETGSVWVPSVLIEGGSAATPAPDSTARMRTAADGLVSARLPASRVVGIVAAADGFTEEWIPAAATGDGGGSDAVEIPLFRSRLTVAVDRTWGPGGASTGLVTQNNYLWDGQPAPFGATEESSRGYSARLFSLEVTLSWSNGPTASGDLALGIGSDRSQPAFVQDSDRDIAAGAREEHAVLTLDDLGANGLFGVPGLYIGAASATGYLGPAGFPYRLEIDAAFDTAALRLGGCGIGVVQGGGASGNAPGAKVPLPAAVLMVATVAAAAVLLGRRSGPKP